MLTEDQVATVVPALFVRFADRVSADESQVYREEAATGEWLLAVAGLVWLLGRRDVGITPDERSDLNQLLETFEQAGPDPILQRLQKTLDGLPYAPQPPLRPELVTLPSTEGRPDWRPADEQELELLDAAADGARFVQLLTAADFYLPVVDDSTVWPRSLPPLDGWHGVAFTSPETADWLLGGLVTECTFEIAETLAEGRPPGFELTVNPGLPISAVLTLAELRDASLRAERGRRGSGL